MKKVWGREAKDGVWRALEDLAVRERRVIKV